MSKFPQNLKTLSQYHLAFIVAKIRCQLDFCSFISMLFSSSQEFFFFFLNPCSESLPWPYVGFWCFSPIQLLLGNPLNMKTPLSGTLMVSYGLVSMPCFLLAYTFHLNTFSLNSRRYYLDCYFNAYVEFSKISIVIFLVSESSNLF